MLLLLRFMLFRQILSFVNMNLIFLNSIQKNKNHSKLFLYADSFLSLNILCENMQGKAMTFMHSYNERQQKTQK